MPRDVVPGSARYNLQTLSGLHYHINYLTPYWDAEGGFQLDTSFLTGVTVPGLHESVRDAQMLTSQLANPGTSVFLRTWRVITSAQLVSRCARKGA